MLRSLSNTHVLLPQGRGVHELIPIVRGQRRDQGFLNVAASVLRDFGYHLPHRCCTVRTRDVVGLRLPTTSICPTLVYMSMTLSVRTDTPLRAALEKRAAAEGKTVSQVAREILEDALTERPLKTRAGHLKGRLELERRPAEQWRKRLRNRNWRQ